MGTSFEIFILINLYGCMYVCMYVQLCMYTYLCLLMYMYIMYVCMLVCMYSMYIQGCMYDGIL